MSNALQSNWEGNWSPEPSSAQIRSRGVPFDWKSDWWQPWPLSCWGSWSSTSCYSNWSSPAWSQHKSANSWTGSWKWTWRHEHTSWASAGDDSWHVEDNSWRAAPSWDETEGWPPKFAHGQIASTFEETRSKKEMANASISNQDPHEALDADSTSCEADGATADVALNKARRYHNLPAPSQEDRAFVAGCNHLAACTASPGFGDIIPPTVEIPWLASASHCRRLVEFAKLASARWPQLGRLETFKREVTEVRAVDRSCAFWLAGRERYLDALARYIGVFMRGDGGDELGKQLLGDIGFHVHENFISVDEEKCLYDYWLLDVSAQKSGCQEAKTKRRFFHYGPVLQLRTDGSSKSTLGIIPGCCGAFPPIVSEMGLPTRIREKAFDLGDKLMGFDQLYVNHYRAQDGARIDFHHDNPKTMRQVVAGISLGGSCEFSLLPLDRELEQVPIKLKLKPRSLYLMSGLSRYHLQHGIAAAQEDRLSLTFRTLCRDCCAHELWLRTWDEFSPEETANAHWPLLPSGRPQEEPIPPDQ